MFDMQPELKGERVALRPLRADDWEALYAVASDPLIWAMHPAPDRWQEEIFRTFFAEALAGGGAFAIIDPATGAVIGSTRYHGWDTERSEIEIGWTFLARSQWGGAFNGEMKRLMLDHAFRFVESVIFLIGPENWRSRRAVEKIGGTLDGVAMRFGRESVVYRIRRPA